jgi:predicted HAD superfamily Cof-like phosphohydrolase
MNKSEITNFERVKEFHKVFGRTPDPETPTAPTRSVLNLRWNLITEEYNEVKEEFYPESGPVELPKVAKELCDLLYVVYGTGAQFGIDLDKCFAEVHRSNMSKLDKDGKVIRREDGKVLKSDLYTPPDMNKVLYGENNG